MATNAAIKEKLYMSQGYGTNILKLSEADNILYPQEEKL